MTTFAHTLNLKVRDYECDLQGIVNNSVYQNYLEHARHEFLLSKNISFSQLADEGINLVVVRAEIDYKSPLKSGDEFWVGTSIESTKRLKGTFRQAIYRKSTNQEDQLAVEAVITWAAINKAGKPLKIASVAETLQTS